MPNMGIFVSANSALLLTTANSTRFKTLDDPEAFSSLANDGLNLDESSNHAEEEKEVIDQIKLPHRNIFPSANECNFSLSRIAT